MKLFTFLKNHKYIFGIFVFSFMLSFFGSSYVMADDEPSSYFGVFDTSNVPHKYPLQISLIDCLKAAFNYRSDLSVSYNSLEDRIHLYCENVIDFCNDRDRYNTYDLILCNPPYFKTKDDNKT